MRGVEPREPGVLGAHRVQVFGVPFFQGSLDDAVQIVIQSARDGLGGYLCLCNVHVLESAKRDDQLMEALQGARLVLPDGQPIAWAQKLEHGKTEQREVAARIGGPDLMELVLDMGRVVGVRHAFYGSTVAVQDRMVEALGKRLPGLQIVARVVPPIGPEADTCNASDLAMLRDQRADIIWVALGAPRQELWAAHHTSALSPSIVIGVGAAFDFLAGTKPRAPRWMQRSGLEWLHRLWCEPVRLGPRYLTTNTRFLIRLAAATLGARIRRRGHR